MSPSHSILTTLIISYQLWINSAFKRAIIQKFSFDYNDTSNDEWIPPIYPVDDPHCKNTTCLVTARNEFVYRQISTVNYYHISISTKTKINEDKRSLITNCHMIYAKDIATASTRVPSEFDNVYNSYSGSFTVTVPNDDIFNNNPNFTIRLGTTSNWNDSKCFWYDVVILGSPYFTRSPTKEPTIGPTKATQYPTSSPTIPPTVSPIAAPSSFPSRNPTFVPTANPTSNPILFATTTTSDIYHKPSDVFVKVILVAIVITTLICVIFAALNMNLFCTHCRKVKALTHREFAPSLGSIAEAAPVFHIRQPQESECLPPGSDALFQFVVNVNRSKEEQEEVEMLANTQLNGEKSIVWEEIETLRCDEGPINETELVMGEACR